MKKLKSNMIDDELLESLLRNEFDQAASSHVRSWLKLIEKLPNNMKYALLKELQLGNNVSQIQDLDWPQKGSIVISMKLPFKNKNPTEIEGISFRKMDDPHYWMEDIHTVVNGIEYLIIT